MSRRVLAASALGLLGLAALSVPWPGSAGSGDPAVIEIEASQYAFLPAVVKVARGQEVVIELSSLDVVHGLYIDGYDLRVTAEAGRPARMAFVADRPGSYRMRCSVTCGPLHPFMTGWLRVDPEGRGVRFFVGIAFALSAGLALALRDESPSHP